jgi:DNA repair protein RecN (Recombination protein N)
VLELSAGFTALTGETGAGKTMVVTALGLLFGGRADPARVRPGRGAGRGGRAAAGLGRR